MFIIILLLLYIIIIIIIIILLWRSLSGLEKNVVIVAQIRR